MHELDKLQKQRVDVIEKDWHDGHAIEINDIFVSNRVLESLDESKTIVEGFRLPEVLPLIPFTQTVYVMVCPYCIDHNNIEPFRKLVQTGLEAIS